MSETATALDLGFSVHFNGRKYDFAPTDNLSVVGNYEAYLEDHAWSSLERARAKMTPQAFAEHSEGTRVDVNAGLYHYLARGWKLSLNSTHHIKHLFWLMVTYHHRDEPITLIDAMFKDKKTRAELQRKLIMDLGRVEDVDPNVLLKAAGLPPEPTSPIPSAK